MQGMIPISVLDLAPIVEGGSATQSFANSVDLARHAEALGFQRYWLAEHHNMPGIASAATAVVIGHVAAATATIRVGAGGIMLPNHAPLVIAEQFGTLAAMHPGRIDLGLGRAPGSDQVAARAMRRTLAGDVDRFPQDVLELMAYFQPAQPGQILQAVPGEGQEVPIWILGSSLFGASLAAALGLPFAFASHFAPAMLEQALEVYRTRFQPSEALERPHVMLGLSVVAADDDETAQLLFTSQKQSILRLRTGQPGRLPPPARDFHDERLDGPLGDSLAAALVGGPERVREGLETFLRRHAPQELIVSSQIYDHEARKHSLSLVAAARDTL